jgi:hypothetical protein
LQENPRREVDYLNKIVMRQTFGVCGVSLKYGRKFFLKWKDIILKVRIALEAFASILHSLMVTTNLAFEEWTEIFGSEGLMGALLDRLTHRCHILEANGESYRLRQARERSNSKLPTRQGSKQE